MVETLFLELVRSFVYDRFALDPVAATVAGVHEHDHEYGDHTAAGYAARRAFSESSLTRFERAGGEELDPAQRIDRDLILAELRGERALHSFERWRRDPGLYPGLITRGAYYLVTREFTRVEERLALCGERLAQAPAVLDAARANLDPARVPVA